MEHRWGERYRVNLTVTVLDTQGRAEIARIRDISASGAFIRCGAPLQPGARITLHFRRTQSSPVLRAHVTRRGADGVGIEWLEYSPGAIAPLLKRAASYRLRAAQGTTVKRPPQQSPALNSPLAAHRRPGASA
jgi:PilZ domain